MKVSPPACVAPTLAASHYLHKTAHKCQLITDTSLQKLLFNTRKFDVYRPGARGTDIKIQHLKEQSENIV